jgi:hypothetical protein
MYLRFDYYFSYWVFTWYLLYEFKITKYNPKFGLIIALIENFVVLILMVYYKNSFLYIFLVCLGISLFKLTPLWRLRYTSIKLRDVYMTFTLFIVYILWLIINHFHFKKFMNVEYNNIKNNKPSTPFAKDVDEIIKLINKQYLYLLEK